jgi:hypothetical protein
MIATALNSIAKILNYRIYSALPIYPGDKLAEWWNDGIGFNRLSMSLFNSYVNIMVAKKNHHILTTEPHNPHIP